MQNVLGWLRSYLSLVFSLLVLVGVGYFLLLPWGRQAWQGKILSAEITQRNQEVLGPKLARLEELDPVLLKSQINQLEQIFPSDKLINQIFADLEDLARQKQAGLSGLTYLFTETEESLDEEGVISLNFLVSGETENLRSFLAQLEKPRPYLKLKGLTYLRAARTDQIPTDEEPSFAQLTLVLRTYYQPLVEELPAVIESLPQLSPSEEKLLAKIHEFKPLISRTVKTEEIEAPTVNFGQENPF